MVTITKETLKVSKIRHSEYYNLIETFDLLYEQSKNNKVFTKLYEIVVSENNIKLAYRNMRKNSGSRTPGVDGLTITHLNKLNEDEFVRIATNKLKNYKPKRVRRVEIPKTNGKTRPLGIPTIWDRLI